MKKISFFMILISAILCISLNALAAQMKYSFEFTSSEDGVFNDAPLDQGTRCIIDLYGDSDDIVINANGRPELANLVGEMYIENLGVYSLTDLWTIQDGDYDLGYDYFVAAITTNGPPLYCPYVSTKDYTLSEDLRWEGNLEDWVWIFQTETSGGSFQDYPQTGQASYQQSHVPIPSAIILLSSGLALLIGFRRKLGKA